MRSPKRLDQIDFNVPGIKPVGMELIKLLNMPDPDVGALARTIELDPALFGSVLACANSPLYSGIAETVDVRMAIVRLGMKEIRRIVFHVVLDSAFRSDNAEINRFLRTVWTQNLAVSLSMQHLILYCPQVRALPVDMVAMIYPLGLLHLIGIPVLIVNYYAEFAAFLRNDIGLPFPNMLLREKEVFYGFNHAELGREIVQRWKFPDFVADVIGLQHQPDPVLEERPRVLHSLLRTARHLALNMGYAIVPTAPEGFWLQGSALDLSGVDLVEFAEDIKAQLAEIARLFF